MRYTKKELTEQLAKPEITELYGIYQYSGKRRVLHTDTVKNTYKESIEELVFDQEQEIECDLFVLDEEEFNLTLNANCGDKADFEEWYDDKEAKVIVIVLPEFA